MAYSTREAQPGCLMDGNLSTGLHCPADWLLCWLMCWNSFPVVELRTEIVCLVARDDMESCIAMVFDDSARAERYSSIQ